MNAFLESLRYYFNLLLNLPHHLLVYIAAAAVLLICIPILRSTLGSRRKTTATVDVAYPSMFGLTTPAVDQIDFRPQIEFSPEPVPIPPRSVTAINESSTVPCIHCGVSMSSHRDFCPACGYAQPMKQSVTA